MHYFNLTGEWRIEGKNTDPYNVTATVTYGTKRINAYKIMEDTLNLKPTILSSTDLPVRETKYQGT